MAYTYTLHLKDFRSIRDASVDLAPLTVIYGANGSGKSSLIYGLLALRNFLTNPNQNVASLFSFPTLSLGGLNEVVRNHVESRKLSLALAVASIADGGFLEDVSPKFTLEIGESGGNAKIAFSPSYGVSNLYDDLDLDIPFPYGANQEVDGNFCISFTSDDGPGDLEGKFRWNGLSVSVPSNRQDIHLTEYKNIIEGFVRGANMPMELARQTGFVPLRRGFSKPSYGASRITDLLATEDEVATLLANERFLQYEVSDYMEMVAGRRIQTQSQLGVPSFTIDSIPLRSQGVPTSIVNEGFGINQLAYMLTICLHQRSKIVAIEEPEIHLHPSIIRKLAHAMAEITAKSDRCLVVSTHSETFVLALLAQIAAGKASADDISFILAEKRDSESAFTRQEATSDGQIQGGLEAFIASEFEDLAVFLGLSSQ